MNRVLEKASKGNKKGMCVPGKGDGVEEGSETYVLLVLVISVVLNISIGEYLTSYLLAVKEKLK